MRRGNKYKNVKCSIDGYNFDSKREMHRYLELRTLQNAGKISSLELQPKYPLMCGSKPIKIRNKNGVGRQANYIADFRYMDNVKGNVVVEDVKGMDTSTSRLKRAIVEAHYNVEVKIVR